MQVPLASLSPREELDKAARGLYTQTQSNLKNVDMSSMYECEETPPLLYYPHFRRKLGL